MSVLRSQLGRARSCVQVLLATALALGAVAAPAQTSPRNAVEAIWRVQGFDFTHRSARGFYACDDLQARLARILTTLGAHESVKVEMQCTGSRRVSSVRARISVAVPVEATEENVQAASTFDARDRLVARLGGFALPTAAEVERFPAVWQRVALSERGRRRIDASECELLSDVQEQILPRFRVRGGARLYCVPWGTHVMQTLDIEALVRASDR